MKYIKEFNICDDFRTSDFVKYFLKTSNEESIINNLDNNKLISLGYTWMIYKWRINIIRKPKISESVKVNTWASGFKNLYAFREFEMFSNEDLLCKASVIFILIDLKKRKPIIIPKDVINYYSCDEKRNFKNIERINIKKDFELINSFSYEVVKSDIDENNHVNNLVYIDLMKKALPKELNNLFVDNISIHYMKEIKLEDNIVIDVFKNNNKLFFEFKSNNKELKHARSWISYNVLAS